MSPISTFRISFGLVFWSYWILSCLHAYMHINHVLFKAHKNGIAHRRGNASLPKCPCPLLLDTAMACQMHIKYLDSLNIWTVKNYLTYHPANDGDDGGERCLIVRRHKIGLFKEIQPTVIIQILHTIITIFDWRRLFHHNSSSIGIKLWWRWLFDGNSLTHAPSGQ